MLLCLPNYAYSGSALSSCPQSFVIGRNGCKHNTSAYGLLEPLPISTIHIPAVCCIIEVEREGFQE